jgi:nucleoid DNA-binding protein
MKQKEISRFVHEHTGLTFRQIESVFVALREAYQSSIDADAEFKLAGIGRFDTYVSKDTKRYNPFTGEDQVVPSQKRVRFSTYYPKKVKA